MRFLSAITCDRITFHCGWFEHQNMLLHRDLFNWQKWTLTSSCERGFCSENYLLFRQHLYAENRFHLSGCFFIFLLHTMRPGKIQTNDLTLMPFANSLDVALLVLPLLCQCVNLRRLCSNAPCCI